MDGWTLLGQPGSEGAGPLALVAMCVGSNADRRLEVFAVDAGGLMHHIVETAPDVWSEWAILDDSSRANPPGERDFGTNAPFVGRQSDGRLQVFGLTSQSYVKTIYEKKVGSDWSAWGEIWGFTALGSFSGYVNAYYPIVASNVDGRLELFAWVNTTDGYQVYHRWQTSPANGWDDSIESLGAPEKGDGPAPLAAATHFDGSLRVYTLSANGMLGRRQKGPHGKGGWTPWQFTANPTTVTGSPALGRNQDGRLEVFSLRPDGSYWHQWQTDFGDDDAWTNNWVSLGGAWAGSPVVSIDPEAHLHVFGLAVDGTIQFAHQTAPNATTWTEFTSIGTPTSFGALAAYPSLASPVSGGADISFPRLRLFAIDAGVLWVRQVGIA
jgi:hypothetical protein